MKEMNAFKNDLNSLVLRPYSSDIKYLRKNVVKYTVKAKDRKLQKRKEK